MVDDTGWLADTEEVEDISLGVEGWRRSNCWRIWGLPSLQLAGKKEEERRS